MRRPRGPIGSTPAAGVAVVVVVALLWVITSTEVLRGTLQSPKGTPPPSTRDEVRHRPEPVELPPVEDTAQASGEVPLPDFSIVILSYKAPKSLQALLGSLAKAGILAHAHLKEVVVYFQVRQPADDELVRSAIGSASVKVTVAGDANNYPVATATFKALGAVTTPYVLYLECDRPAFPYDATRFDANAAIDTALRFLSRGVATLFRLQLYDNPLLAEGAHGDTVLKENTYGRETHKNCLAAPEYAADVCKRAKKERGPVFNTAYCKHWKKFASPKSQQDLCDAFCFATWASTDDGPFRGVRSAAPEKFGGVTLYTAAGEALGSAAKPSSSTASAEVVCLTSEECNWTNQPTMYSKAWYEANIRDRCNSDRDGCVGVPGRRSAVLQEQFFLKPKSGWAAARHPICLHTQGVFYHNEVDNG
jgi:hypothetical protein